MLVHVGKTNAPWTGSVVRRDPTTYQLPSVIEFWKCPSCHHFTPEGSRAAGRCLICHTPTPPHT